MYTVPVHCIHICIDFTSLYMRKGESLKVMSSQTQPSPQGQRKFKSCTANCRGYKNGNLWCELTSYMYVPELLCTALLIGGYLIEKAFLARVVSGRLYNLVSEVIGLDNNLCTRQYILPTSKQGV